MNNKRDKTINISSGDCFFCNIPKDRVIHDSERFVVIHDAYPVTEGHTLLISKRHAETWFDLTAEEKAEVNDLLQYHRNKLKGKHSDIAGFNIGINCGESAGQTIFHCHIHLIPRRKGDCPNPRGGVRGVIPNKQQY